MKWKTIVSLAKKVVETKKTSAENASILTKGVLNPGKEATLYQCADAPNPYNGTVNITLTKDEYTAMAKDIKKFIIENKRLPNYALHKKTKIGTKLFIHGFAKIIVFYDENKRLPNTCEFNNKTTTKTKGGAVCKAVSDKTGVTITDYKTLYKAFTKFKYEYYYNDKKTKNTTIKDKAGNCADLNQIAYQCLKELGYKVEIVRGEVKCDSGTFGHIWCRLTISKKKTIFDASAAAKGKSLGSLICGTGKVTDVNPSWLLSDDGVT